MESCFSGFHHPELLTIKQLDRVNLLELWHGPTGAFKDYSLSFMGKTFSAVMRRNKTKGVGLVGTLGDTGSAAIHSFKGRDNLGMCYLWIPTSGLWTRSISQCNLFTRFIVP